VANNDAFGMTAPEAQAVVAPLTGAAVFLVLTVRDGEDAVASARALLGELSALVRAVGSRDPAGTLTCVLGIGSDVWDRLIDGPRPAELHPFVELRAGDRHAPSTPGDLLFHIRATRMDLCYELATVVMTQLAGAVDAVDEVHGFSYFDQRDVIGFVDGTENPTGALAVAATLVGAEDPAFAGGSYVIVQKYLHDLAAWDTIAVAEQERIVGRTKLGNIELDDEAKPPYAHNALTKIVRDGAEVKILRDNMPFGAPGTGEHGTYFIGYCRTPSITEEMLRHMFVGNPEGVYDRLLDISRAVTGCLFFVPPAGMLEAFGEG
jgi:porphyrinogen peroxidase